MNDMLYQRLRLIHYTTRLPVQWLEDRSCLFSLPQAMEWIGSILALSGPLSLITLPTEKSNTTLRLQNAYGERYAYLEVEAGKAVLVGPYALDAYSEAEGLQIIRHQQPPLKHQRAILAHLSVLPRLSEPSCFYLGKLLEMVFSRESLQAAEASKAYDTPEDVEAPYYQNAYANRMALFHHPPLFFEQELSRQIAAGSPENAKRVLLELNTLSRARLATSPIRSLKNSLICSVTLFTRAAIEGGVPVDEAFTLSDTCIQSIEQLSDGKALSAFEEEVVMQFVNRVARYKSQRYSPSIQRAVQYIDDHLAEMLPLPAIAAYAYIHPDYLSARFRKETGVTVTEFIQKRRVEESAHFLRYSESSVSEIAAFYRFCSQSYFIQVFKKYMGATPAAYRSRRAAPAASEKA